MVVRVGVPVAEWGGTDNPLIRLETGLVPGDGERVELDEDGDNAGESLPLRTSWPLIFFSLQDGVVRSENGLCTGYGWGRVKAGAWSRHSQNRLF